MNLKRSLSLIFILGVVVDFANARTTSGSPSFQYTSLQLNYLVGPVEKIIYDESSLTFDRNGNLIQQKDKYVELNYTYSKKGYTIHNQHGGFEGEWRVTIDENKRQRIDRRVDEQSIGEISVYTFDERGRHISTQYEEHGRTVITTIHYPNTLSFLPDSSWTTTYYSGYLDDESVCAYWYNKVDKKGNWLEEQLEDDKTRYYSAYYYIRQVGYFDEPLITRDEIARMKELIHGPNGERLATTGNNRSGRLTLVDKKYEPTEYEKNITQICQDYNVDGHSQEKSSGPLWIIIVGVIGIIAIAVTVVLTPKRQ